MDTNHNASGKKYVFLSFLLFLSLFVLVVLTFAHYGYSWDEAVQYEYGDRLLTYYRTFGHNQDVNSYLNLYLYGGFFELFLAGGRALLNFLDRNDASHLLIGLTGILGFIGCFRTARFVSGTRAAFFSAVLLLCLPTYCGHMFNNSKDVPFAIGYLFSIYYLMQAFERLPRIPNGIILKLSVAIGITSAIRVGGLILYAAVLFSFFLFLCQSRKKPGWDLVKSYALPLGAAFVKIVALSYAILIFFWPWSQAAPFTRPFQALHEFSAFPYFASAPFYYIPKFMGIKFPEIILLILFGGFLWLIAGIAARKIDLRAKATSHVVILLFASAFPALYIIAMKSSLYDEIRQVLFIQLPMVVLAGLLLDRFMGFLGQKRPRLLPAAYLVLCTYLLFHAVVLVRLFPYQYIYYNQFVGGPAGAAKLGQPIDYWAHSYREITADLAAFLRRDLKGAFDKTTFRIYVAGAPWSASYYFPKNFVLTPTPQDADFIITFTRNGIDRTFPGKTILTVERLNVPLSYVKDNRTRRTSWP